MSRILRRPMFRGGPVSSYGTGIASGLGDRNRVNMFEGGWPHWAIEELQSGTAKKPTTGGGILSQAMNKIRNVPYLGKIIPAAGGTLAKYSPYALAAGAGIGIGEVTDWITKATDTPEAYAYRKQAVRDDPWAYHETDLEIDEEGNMTTRGAMIDEKIKELDVGEKPGLFPRGGIDKWYADRNIDQETGKEIKTEKSDPEFKPTVVNNNTGEPEVTPELTAKEMVAENKELFRDLLGYDKAKGQDISEMLLGFAGAEGDDTWSKFKSFFRDEAKRPGKAQKIDETAAALAINDYIAGKRSKEKIAADRANIKYAQDVKLDALVINEDDSLNEVATKLASVDQDLNTMKGLRKVIKAKDDSDMAGLVYTSTLKLKDIGNPTKNAKVLKKLKKGYNIIDDEGVKWIVKYDGSGSIGGVSQPLTISKFWNQKS